MKKLSTLIRRENCFFTKDNQTIRTIQDLLDYLVDCDEETYSYHVNSQKNDFANWVRDVLLFPALAISLRMAKNVSEARDALIEFFEVFDYKSKTISEDKSFHTIDDYKLKNIQELYYYLNNCDDGSFSYHVNVQKNDFANWVSDVLLFPALSAKMRIVRDKRSMVIVLKEFLLSSTAYDSNPEYEKYVNERLVHEDVKSSQESVKPYQKLIQTPAAEDKNSISSTSIQSSTTPSSTPNSTKSESSSSSINVPSKSPILSSSNNREETINLDKKFEYVREEEPEKNTDSPIDKNAFRQFTDEELDRFISFTKREKVVDNDMKVEYLKTILQELKNMIRDLRRAEKDPLIADLMLRTINAKIDYYANSKNVEDYNHIIRLMKDVQSEIEDSSEHQSYNIAEEILKDLRLQGIAMKKA